MCSGRRVKGMRGAKVKKIYSERYGLSVDIRLEKSSMTFFCVIGGELITASSYDEIKPKVHSKIKDIAEIEFKPYIIVGVSYEGEHDRGGGIKLQTERLYLGIKPDGNIRYLEFWQVEDIDSLDKDELLTRSSYYNHIKAGTELEDSKDSSTCDHRVNGRNFSIKTHSTEVYRPYTEELWQALQSFNILIADAGNRIMELLGTEKGLNLLIQKQPNLITFDGEAEVTNDK
jgi:hypothetical protein